MEAGADVRVRSRRGTPLGIGSKKLVNEFKQTLSFAAKRIIAVIGHAECGKSTLIAALEAEGKSWFRKVRDNRQRTAGIEAIEFSSRKYGEALFYDFAGQTQYHSPHQSFLEAMLSKPGASVALLLLVKATAEEDIITQQLFHWLHPVVQMSAPSTVVVMVVGSFLDAAESGHDRSAKKEAHEKLLRCIQSAQQEFPFQIKGPCLLDCRWPESVGISEIRSFLQTAKPLQLKPEHVPHNMVLTKPLISYNLHWVLVQLRKTFSIPAVRLHVFQKWLQDNAGDLPKN
ncbi:MAG: 50S ribosome-binding GTPase, partial [Alphaproteobacteria bacterium]|nr:50S ribosome-binding GTPase [Alphaproteobacteria bacterium]